VPFEDRAWYKVRRWSFDAVANRDGFTLIGNTANDFTGLEDLMNRHADRMRWDIGQTGKPALSYLL
jgi:hypothetical protein